MTRVLIVKLSSFGDVVHTLPAVTDLAESVPGVAIDWAVEPAFAPLARLHPAVTRVIETPLRKMKKGGDRFATLRAVFGELRAERYDAIIDAQGLMKSAVLARLARGPRHGYGRSRAREGAAALLYTHAHALPGDHHVIALTRGLFADSLGYAVPETPPRSGLDRRAIAGGVSTREILLAHGTAWRDKLWPAAHWRSVAADVAKRGFTPLVPHVGASEEERARAIVEDIEGAELLAPLPLDALARRIASATAVVGGDTGISHLAGALDVPVVTLFGPTTPRWSGTLGLGSINLEAPTEACALRPCMKHVCQVAPAAEIAPCMAALTPDRVTEALCASLSAP
jgi:heptosyltransferase-1